MRVPHEVLSVALSACLTTLAAGGLASRSLAQRSETAPRPNLLMIVLDDVGTDKLASFDELDAPPYARTPRIDALGDEGIRFRNFYTSTVCSPARACIQTGRYGQRTGLGSSTNGWKLPDSEVLLAELLRKGHAPGEGYRSGAFGKWHLGEDDAAHAVNNGYQRFYGSLRNTDGHYLWMKVEHDADSAGPRLVPSSTWSASVVRADALRWIRAQDRPFFAYVSFNPPHNEWQLPPKALLSDLTQAELVAYPEGAVATTPEERQLFYRAMLEAVDTEIGALLDGMDPLQRENTTIFVVSDNGTPGGAISPPHDPTHGKSTVYQLGIRVPMIVSGKSVPDAPPGGFRCDQLVEAVDFWRTFAEITGADETLAFERSGFSAPYPEIDSVSFLPLILDPNSTSVQPWVFSQFFVPAGPYTDADCLRVHVRAITDGEYKYIRWEVKDESEPLCSPPTYGHEFYRIATDFEERRNLLKRRLAPHQQTVFDYLSAEMDQLSEY